jgi:hypothetical protein
MAPSCCHWVGRKTKERLREPEQPKPGRPRWPAGRSAEPEAWPAADPEAWSGRTARWPARRSGRPAEPEQITNLSEDQLQPRLVRGFFVAGATRGTATAKPRCVPMNKNPTAKTIKTAEELTVALNKAIQAHPECQGIKLFKLTALADSHGIANWDAEFAADPGVRAWLSRWRRLFRHFLTASSSRQNDKDKILLRFVRL